MAVPGRCPRKYITGGPEGQAPVPRTTSPRATPLLSVSYFGLSQKDGLWVKTNNNCFKIHHSQGVSYKNLCRVPKSLPEGPLPASPFHQLLPFLPGPPMPSTACLFVISHNHTPTHTHTHTAVSHLRALLSAFTPTCLTCQANSNPPVKTELKYGFHFAPFCQHCTKRYLHHSTFKLHVFICWFTCPFLLPGA